MVDPSGAGREAAEELAVGADVRLDLTAMAHGGPALGRHASGAVVFVDGGLPGEAVTARITEVAERHAHAVLAAVPPEPSTARLAEASCPLFGSWPERGHGRAEHCGGCQWQHVRYPAQLELKREVMVDALRRIGGLAEPPVLPVVGMAGEPWGFRNRLTVRVTATGAGLISVDGVTAVVVERCPVAHPMVNDLLDAVGPELPLGMEVVLRAGLRTGDQMMVLRDEAGAIEELEIDRPLSVVLSGPRGIEPAAGQAHLVERLRERPFLIPAESFFQTNTEMAEVLVDIVDGVIPDGVDLLVDAYSGVGTFAVCLADRARRVVAVETDARAVQAATMNASGLDNVTLIEGTASEGLAWCGERPDVLLVDPPRSGLSRRLVRLIADQRPPTIVYVSCEPATLARDARQLCSAGWHLAECRPIDMFPHTYHVESVTVFRR